MLTHQDEHILSWLSAISPIVCQSQLFSPTSIFVERQHVTISCRHQHMARLIRNYHEKLKTSNFALKILVGGKQYAFIPPQNPMKNILYENATVGNSRWARMNQSVLDLMSDDGTVSIHSADRDGGYKTLTVQPYQRIDAVLCLPKNQLVGQVVSEGWDKARPETQVIAVTKRRVIEEAIASQQKTTHTYEMRWSGLLWRMSVTGVLVNEGEVLLITRQLEDYQRKFWDNWEG